MFMRDEQGKIVLDEEGFQVELSAGPFYGLTDLRKSAVPVRRSPVPGPIRTYRPLRRIGGNPNGTWESIKTWWTGLKPEYRYGIVAAPFLVAVIAVAAGKGEGKAGLEKI